MITPIDDSHIKGSSCRSRGSSCIYYLGKIVWYSFWLGKLQISPVFCEVWFRGKFSVLYKSSAYHVPFFAQGQSPHLISLNNFFNLVLLERNVTMWSFTHNLLIWRWLQSLPNFCLHFEKMHLPSAATVRLDEMVGWKIAVHHNLCRFLLSLLVPKENKFGRQEVCH